MFSFLKTSLSKIYHSVTQSLTSLFSRTTFDESLLEELEKILLSADTGAHTTRTLLSRIRKAHEHGHIQEGSSLKTVLQQELLALLAQPNTHHTAAVYVLVGINGSGKTTCAAKLAALFAGQKKRVLLVAADTFRAAAVQQLHSWATRLGIECVSGTEGQDPASVIFSGCQQYKDGQYDVLIIDTAGRLQTKVNLMHELAKMKKVIARQLPERSVCTLLTVDAMLGQNSFEQAKIFNEATPLQGIVLTKMDGTGKGGIVFAVVQELKVPIVYISCGEKVGDLKDFNAQEYVAMLLGD